MKTPATDAISDDLVLAAVERNPQQLSQGAGRERNQGKGTGEPYQCTPRVSVAIAICSNDARSSTSGCPREAAESGKTR